MANLVALDQMVGAA